MSPLLSFPCVQRTKGLKCGFRSKRAAVAARSPVPAEANVLEQRNGCGTSCTSLADCRKAGCGICQGGGSVS